MRNDLPPETPAAAQARAEAVAEWLDAAAFESLLDLDARQGRSLEQCLQSGVVFAVWVPESHAFLFPQWQLDSAGRPSIALSAVLALLRGEYGVSGGERTSGWEELEWLIAPHARLHGSSPSQMLILAPTLVLEAARQDFSSWSADARW
ncbi:MULTISPECIES: hypothetical protein [Stenotrophomonas]|uniref:DUF2750 domain-containing protein n=1 Tax=Stenotrophomonas lactitubi TaxID=2045214 RepID=A0AAW4GBY5_9GAMM|nr:MULTISPECIES: hypothetical protein [Stenotrophomonas]MBM9912283.1 hypothetical protein [Stenotrophomonas lactitubi]MBM9920679.1 hypothetical protein [Stenotrophomonas lactitubi]MBM9937879.1 hypothetical protein [Stenotrophomonas lactitubi]